MKMYNSDDQIINALDIFPLFISTKYSHESSAESVTATLSQISY